MSSRVPPPRWVREVQASVGFFQSQFNVRSQEQGCPSERFLLYQEWANPKSFYKMQPLNLIR